MRTIMISVFLATMISTSSAQIRYQMTHELPIVSAVNVSLTDSGSVSLRPMQHLVSKTTPIGYYSRPLMVSTFSTSLGRRVAVDYRPPTREERLRWYRKNAFGPIALFRASMGTGFSHRSNDPPEWNRNFNGLARRFGSHAAEVIIQETMRYAVGPVFHEDTQYYKCDCTGFFPRLGHSLLSTFTARSRDGHRKFSFVNTAAPFVGAFTAVNVWYPKQYGLADSFRGGGLAVAGSAGTNILREFLFR